MTRKEKYDFLNQYVTAEKRINNLIQEKMRWEYKRGAIGGIGGDGCGNSTFNVTSKVENVAIRINEIEQMIDEQIETCKMGRVSVQYVIDSVRDTRKRLLLEMRFFRGLTAWQISLELDKDYSTIRKALNKAVDSVAI